MDQNIMNQKIIIYPKQSKMVFLGLASLLFVVIGIIMLVNVEEIELPLTLAIAVSFLCILFFSICFIYIFYRIFHRKPSLIVDEYGITDNSSAISVGLVKWMEMKDLFLYDYMGQKFLGVVPKDEQAFFAKMSPVKRKLAQANSKMVKAPINITQNTVSIPLEKVLEYARHYLPITNLNDRVI